MFIYESNPYIITGIYPTETTPDQASKGAEQSRHRHRKVLTNDELFYDPKMDDRDQEWVNQKRRSYQPKRRRYTSLSCLAVTESLLELGNYHDKSAVAFPVHVLQPYLH